MTESVEAQPELQEQPFEFMGSGGEFFKIWIVNFVLSVLTLGIYSAWAKVRTKRYFYGNTRLGNSGFEYHATPIAILKGRLIAVALLLIYIFLGEMVPVLGVVFALALFLVAPWIIWRSIKFNARMSSYRNVRFGFYGSLKDAYRYLLLIPMIPIIVAAGIGLALWLVMGDVNPGVFGVLFAFAILGVYLMVPYIQKAVTSFTINNYRYGQGRLSAELSAGKYYMTYLALIGWSFLFFFVASFLMGMVMAIGGIAAGAMQSSPEADLESAGMVVVFGAVALLYLGMIMFGIWGKAYVQTRIRNYVFNRTQLDNVLQLQSTMTVGKLFGFYLVNLLLMVFTLGLGYPWVKVRIARFSADATQAYVLGSVDQYVTQQQDKQSALGEEMGEAFDVDAAVDLAF
jgi:uncharacterized membrane protein YjgN (DUF898 family)